MNNATIFSQFKGHADVDVGFDVKLRASWPPSWRAMCKEPRWRPSLIIFMQRSLPLGESDGEDDCDSDGPGLMSRFSDMSSLLQKFWQAPLRH